jgi:Mn2+/Fe2+ NRAMP family transporter
LILVLAIKLASDRDLMGDMANGAIRNVLAWATAAVLVALTAALLMVTLVLPVFGVNIGD